MIRTILAPVLAGGISAIATVALMVAALFLATSTHAATLIEYTGVVSSYDILHGAYDGNDAVTASTDVQHAGVDPFDIVFSGDTFTAQIGSLTFTGPYTDHTATEDQGGYSYAGSSGWTYLDVLMTPTDGHLITARGYDSDGYGGYSDAAVYHLTVSSPAPSLASAIPEPEAWALMLVGLGVVGVATRRRVLAV